MYWLKTHENVEEENEISVANKLLFFREKNELFHSISFDTISAIGKNAALPHYRVNKKSNLSFKTKEYKMNTLKKKIVFICVTQGGNIMMEQQI